MLDFINWGADWVYGVPMILLSLAFHGSGLVGIEWLLITIDRKRKKPRSIFHFLVMTQIVVNLALVMHVLEAGAWARLYYEVGALPDLQISMLYSLNAITAYGHEVAALTDDWRLLGAIESMNGVMIFGLTTAFIFNALREFRPVRRA